MLESASSGEQYQNQIDRRSDHPSQVILPDEDNSGAAIMLLYCFREIIRNSFEHAGVNKCFVWVRSAITIVMPKLLLQTEKWVFTIR